MDNANRAGRTMLSIRVKPAYIARKAGFCPGAIGDTPVCAMIDILYVVDFRVEDIYIYIYLYIYIYIYIYILYIY